MEFVYRIKNTVAEYLSPPSKRRRTLGPEAPSTSKDAADQSFEAPASEPRDRKARAAALSRVNKNGRSPIEARVTRKRNRVEYEYEVLEIDEEDISPDDSISQINAQEVDSEEDGIDAATDEEEDEDVEIDESGNDEGSEVTADSNGAGDEVEAETDEEASEGVAIDTDEYEEMEVEVEESEHSDDSNVKYETDEEGADLGEAGSGNAAAADKEASIEAEEEQEEEEQVDPEAQAQAQLEEYLARQAELALRREEVDKARAAGNWHPDRLFLFERIALRSFEPLVPGEWHFDLRTLPENLFAEYDTAFIRNESTHYHYACKALQRLLEVGIRVKDNLNKNPPLRGDRWISWAVKDFVKWAETDGGYRKLLYIPVLVVINARPTQTTDSITKSIESQLQFLAQRHRENLAIAPEGSSNKIGQAVKFRRPPPLLYGMMIVNSIVVCVTLESANPEAKVEHLSHFDFSDKKMAVWNGFALASIITMQKRYILSIKDELEEDTTPDSDPDA